MGMIRYAVTVTTLAFAAVGILSSRGLMAAEQREPSGAELVLEMLAGINATKQLPADAAAGDVSRALGAEAFARGFLIATRGQLDELGITAIPDTTTPEQVAEVIEKSLKALPNESGKSASTLIRQALVHEWPGQNLPQIPRTYGDERSSLPPR